jgi:hypothetical protein
LTTRWFAVVVKSSRVVVMFTVVVPPAVARSSPPPAYGDGPVHIMHEPQSRNIELTRIGADLAALSEL